MTRRSVRGRYRQVTGGANCPSSNCKLSFGHPHLRRGGVESFRDWNNEETANEKDFRYSVWRCAYVMEDTVPHGFAVEVVDCDDIEAPEASRGSACCERLDA